MFNVPIDQCLQIFKTVAKTRGNVFKPEYSKASVAKYQVCSLVLYKQTLSQCGFSFTGEELQQNISQNLITRRDFLVECLVFMAQTK